MTLFEITRDGIDPALALLPAKMDSAAARVMLLAIGLQESRFVYRRQMVGSPPKPTGPAKSFWQGELGGGMVRGVRTHPVTRDHAAVLCAVTGVPNEDRAIWDAIENNDILAAGRARLLLWSDPLPMPGPNDEVGAWGLYLRTWRPGAWSRGTPDERDDLRAKWLRNHSSAREFVS